MNQVHSPHLSHQKSTYVDLSFKGPTASQWDQTEAKSVLNKAVTTGASDSFIRVCKNLKLPHELHQLYRTWFIQHGRSIYNGPVTSNLLPINKGSHGQVPKLPAGWRFPHPSGSTWRKLKKQQTALELKGTDNTAMCCDDVLREIAEQKHTVKDTKRYAFSTKVSASTTHAFQGTGRKKKRGANDSAPQSIQKALEGDDGHAWADSMDKEVNGLTDKGVVLHDQTMNMCREQGINTTPVPIGIYFKEKTNQFGEVTQLKSRAAIQGHKGNMQRGVHFFETYAATPQEDTARILICLAVKNNMKRRSWDVEKAYCCAPIPPAERIILRYPQGFKRFCPQTNEELFMILMMNLYGDPAAGRRWSNHRDTQLLDKFNNDSWTTKRCLMDPTLFMLTWHPEHGQESHMLLSMHTDDFDAIGSNDEILDEFNKIVNTFWTLLVTDNSFMLGWHRIPVFENGRLSSITLTMTAYVKGMADAFRDRLTKRNVNEPFNPRSTVSKDMEVDPGESKLVLEAGYLKAIGLILWAARHSFPESRFGVSILGSVAHKASWQAFFDAMWMIKWIEQNQDRGIRFSADGNELPFGMADASNKPIMSTGLCQGGFCIMWMHGPISSSSLRLHHVGLSSEHNEYMALHLLIKRIVWLRQLLEELGYANLIQEPTKCYGDNVQANKLCKEHFISPGNQYIATQYHFNKEKVESGDVQIHWINTKYNLADIFTKALTKQTFDLLLNYLLGYAGDINKLFEATQAILTEKKDHPSLR